MLQAKPPRKSTNGEVWNSPFWLAWPRFGQCFLAINQNVDQPAFEKPWVGNKWQISCLPFWWIYGGFLKRGLPPVTIHFCLGFSMKETNQLLGILHLYPFWLVVWNMFFFPYTGNNDPNWLIFFRGVETTNQYIYYTQYTLCVCLHISYTIKVEW